MVARPLRNLFYTVLASIGLVLALSALVLLAKTSNNSAELDRLSRLTLIINGAGIVILLLLLLGNIIRLVRDLRRLTGRSGASSWSRHSSSSSFQDMGRRRTWGARRARTGPWCGTPCTSSRR